MHRDMFPDRTPDRVWISDVARRGWIIVTRDKRLQSRHLEWMALLRAKARVLWFKGDRAFNVEIAEGFLTALPKVDALVSRLSPPFIIKVTPTGAVEQVYPEPEKKPRQKQNRRSLLRPQFHDHRPSAALPAGALRTQLRLDQLLPMLAASTQRRPERPRDGDAEKRARRIRPVVHVLIEQPTVTARPLRLRTSPTGSTSSSNAGRAALLIRLGIEDVSFAERELDLMPVSGCL